MTIRPRQSREHGSRKYFLAIAILFLAGLVFAVYYFRPASRLERRIKAEINAKWPPAQNLTESQLKAVTNALDSLDKGKLPSADMYIEVSKAALQEIVPDLVKARVPQVKRVLIRLGRQEIIANLEFELTHEKPSLTLKGTAVIHNTVTIKNGMWTLTPIASGVNLKSVKFGGLPEVSFITHIANDILAKFISNVSAQIVQESSDNLSFSPIRTLSPKEVLGDENFTDLTGNMINLRAGIGAIAVFVDDDGFHALANVVPLSPVRFKEVIDELRKKPPDASTLLSPKQTAVLSACAVPVTTHNQKEQDDYQEFKKFCEEMDLARKQAPSAVSAGTVTSPRSVSDIYQDVAKQFRSRAEEVDTIDNLLWSKTGVFVSKSLVARILNEMAGDPHYGGVYRPVDFPFAFRQELRTEKASNLNCDKIPCNCTADTEPHWNCEGRGCPSDCAWYDVGCHAWKPVCEGLKAADKGTCNLDKGRYRVQKNAENAGAQALWNANVAACNVNQQWLNTWSETQIGLAEVTGEVKRLAVGFEVKSFQVDPSLASFAVNSTFNATADVNSSIKFTPRDFGNLVCLSQWSGDLIGEVKMEPLDFVVTSKLAQVTNESDHVALMFASDQVPTKIKFSPPPFQAVLDHNPKLYVWCTGGVIAKLVGAGSKDTFEYTVPSRKVPLRIPGGDFSVLGTTIYYKPSWSDNTKTIRFKLGSPIWKLPDAS
jgi:hypothetical protein